MGPADHIRTKHEIKAYLATGDSAEATALATRASERREQAEIALREKQEKKHGLHQGQ